VSGDDLLLLEYFWGYEHQRDEVFSHLATQKTVAIVVSVQVEHIDITELVFNFSRFSRKNIQEPVMCTNVADRTINANKPLGTLLMVSTYRDTL
jgi:hypothetical protein